jgi:dihydroflavonol-4-reductase
MAAMARGETVLVTGASGYIGGWCAASLLERGYVVRATVRDLAKEPSARAAIAGVTDPGNRLSFYAVTLTANDGWDAAMEGCDYVLHIASPLGVAEPKDPDVLIKPAREGTLRVIAAAIRADVKRIVLTSSVAATRKDEGLPDWTADETVWTDPNARGISAYAQSKTLAERAAWEIIETAGGKTTLATINPALVLGPVMSRAFSYSVQVVERLLTGRLPGVPKIGFNVVDVRDVADVHIRAMTAPEAAGQRFIAAGRYAWMGDLADLMHEKLDPAHAAKVTRRRVPGIALRIAGLFDKELASVVPRLGRKHDYSSSKAQTMLGWKPRPLEATILDCANSLIALGVV